MGCEINLLEHYPKTKRNVLERGQSKTEDDRFIARQFGKEFFDGDRKHGYGGFTYQPRFWQPVVPTFQAYYQLTKSSSILDVGCAKGFMLYDFITLIPGIKVRGVDISSYAIEHAMTEMKPYVSVADARELPFEDRAFDLVISINTLHNLDGEDLIQAFREIDRVSRKHCFVTLDAYRDEQEKEAMESWNLTAKTMMHVEAWKTFFRQIGYTGDYYWFLPLS